MTGKKVYLLLDGCTFTAVLDIQSTLVNIGRYAVLCRFGLIHAMED